MKKITLFIYILLINYTYKAQQNLVPNGSFENYLICPNDFGINFFSNDWFGIYSPDLYNGCSNFTTNVSVPLNGFGYQIPRTGQGYCGAGLKETTFYGDYKEYPAIKIKSKLQAGKKYRLTIHANLSNSSTLALDKISAVFVSDTIHGALNPNYTTYPVSPFDTKIDFNCINCFFDDTLSWIKLEKEFSGNGSEQFLIIGSFDYYKNQKFKVVGDTSGLVYAYYYFDEISLVETDNNSSELFIPEIFTPNYDGKNDVFKLLNIL